jgi:hypothetical protein
MKSKEHIETRKAANIEKDNEGVDTMVFEDEED